MMIIFFEEWITKMWYQSPIHLVIEILLFICLLVLLFRKPETIHDPKDELTPEEEDQIIADWNPKPLILDIPEESKDPGIIRRVISTSGPSDTIEIDNQSVLNFGTPNFLGLNMNQEIIKASIEAIHRYNVGTCGTRGFYGTTDAHLNVESSMARFLEAEDSVNYPNLFATIISIVQSFMHNRDIVFIDNGSWFAIQFATMLSPSQSVFFKHNDMSDLREKLIYNRKNYARWQKCNRWVIGEGLYANDGAIWNLKTLIQLRKEFCLRIVIDETFSIGTLGEKGRGLCEHFGIPRSLVELTIGSYGKSFASVGGFTIGSKEVCDHQRLTSFAYTSSTSTPCFNVVAATKAIEIIEKEGEDLIKKLRQNILLMRNELVDHINPFIIISDELSPLIHLRKNDDKQTDQNSFHNDDILLQSIVEACLKEENPVAISKSKYIRSKEINPPPPSLKIYISASHTEEQIKKAAATIKNAIAKIIQ